MILGRIAGRKADGKFKNVHLEELFSSVCRDCRKFPCSFFLKPDSKVVRELRRYSANVQKLSSIVITIRNPKKMSGSSIIKAEHKINLTYFQWSHSILRANGQTQNYPTTYFHL